MNRTRPIRLLLLAIGMATVSASAQIELATKLDYRVYLQFEPIPAYTTVKSSIGQAVVFNSGSDSPTFYFRVNDDYGHQLPVLPDAKHIDPVMISAQAIVNFTNNMITRYSMARPGYYSIQPCVDWMGKTFQGEKKHIEIVTGREIMRLTGRIPGETSTRTFKMFHLNRGQQDHILLRIDDEAASLCYGVFPLGRTVLDAKPNMVLDSVGNAHVLYKSSPYTFSHVTYSPYGIMIDQKVFGQEFGNISLTSQPDGSVQSIGTRDANPGPRPITSIINNR